jgi:hypothetical protein
MSPRLPEALARRQSRAAGVRSSDRRRPFEDAGSTGQDGLAEPRAEQPLVTARQLMWRQTVGGALFGSPVPLVDRHGLRGAAGSFSREQIDTSHHRVMIVGATIGKERLAVRSFYSPIWCHDAGRT